MWLRRAVPRGAPSRKCQLRLGGRPTTDATQATNGSRPLSYPTSATTPSRVKSSTATAGTLPTSCGRKKQSPWPATNSRRAPPAPVVPAAEADGQVSRDPAAAADPATTTGVGAALAAGSPGRTTLPSSDWSPIKISSGWRSPEDNSERENRRMRTSPKSSRSCKIG